jgi:hypothetical protein
MTSHQPLHTMIDYRLCPLPIGNRDALLAAQQKDETMNTWYENRIMKPSTVTDDRGTVSKPSTLDLSSKWKEKAPSKHWRLALAKRGMRLARAISL